MHCYFSSLSVSPTPQKSIGSIADYDPMNGQWGTAAAQPRNSEKLGYLSKDFVFFFGFCLNDLLICNPHKFFARFGTY